MDCIGVVGGGAWGTGLATVAMRAGLDTVLWAREPEVVEAINTDHENTLFLPGVTLDERIRATADMADLAAADLILLVAPAQYARPVSVALSKHVTTDRPVVVCAKGIEQSTGYFMTDVLAETMPANPVVVLSGPTFAGEVALGLPAAVTLACESDVIAGEIIGALGLTTFRPYWTDDLIGAQVGGALKNVLAIACGIVAGLSLGENARAAVITRGMAEMMRFGLSRGARGETLMGLSGLGDLILTCSSTQSRNFTLGQALGAGRSLAEVLDERRSVAEGFYSAEVANRLAAATGIDMPITAAVERLLKQDAMVADVIEELLSRPFTKETP